MILDERWKHVDHGEQLGRISSPEVVDPIQDALGIQLSRLSQQRVVLPPQRDLLQVLCECRCHVQTPFGRKTPLGVDIDRLAPQPVERRRHLNVDRQLHHDLRLPHPGRAAKLRNLSRPDPPAQNLVKVLAERHERLLPPLLVKDLLGLLNERSASRR